MKALEDCTANEVLSMKREDFDEALSKSKLNIGMLETLRKWISLKYDEMSAVAKGLSDLILNPETDEKTRKESETTLNQLYIVMFAVEYKATCLYSRVNELKEKTQTRTFDKSLTM